jgi:ABC-type transport system substrate-binding protein
MVMVPNPDYWDRSNVHLERVTITMGLPTDDQIRAGYRSGALDVARIGDAASFATSRDLARVVTHVGREYSVNFLTLIPSRNPVLRDVRVREAIALAIDRREIAKVSSSAEGSTSLIPSTLPGWDPSVGVTTNVARARSLLAAAGYPRGKGFPTLSIMTTHDDVLIRAVLRGLRRNLGIRAVQDIQAPAIYGAKRQEVQPAPFAGFFTTGYTSILTWRAWVSGTYPPSQTELLSLGPDDYTQYQVLQADGHAKSLDKATRFLEAHASPQSKHFAAVAARADRTADPMRATALYKRMRAARAEGLTYAAIAQRLNEQGVPTAQGGRRWYPATVRSTLERTRAALETEQGEGRR